MIILKIGGSSLTNKDSSKSEVNSDSLKRIALEIKSSLDNSAKELIVVHTKALLQAVSSGMAGIRCEISTVLADCSRRNHIWL